MHYIKMVATDDMSQRPSRTEKNAAFFWPTMASRPKRRAFAFNEIVQPRKKVGRPTPTRGAIVLHILILKSNFPLIRHWEMKSSYFPPTFEFSNLEFKCDYFSILFQSESQFQNSNVGGKELDFISQLQIRGKLDFRYNIISYAADEIFSQKLKQIMKENLMNGILVTV